MGGVAFVASILAVMNCNGWHHIKRANFPGGLAPIEGFYTVPVIDGPAGYADAYGREIQF